MWGAQAKESAIAKEPMAGSKSPRCNELAEPGLLVEADAWVAAMAPVVADGAAEVVTASLALYTASLPSPAQVGRSTIVYPFPRTMSM